jgi:hypothetical protein
MMPSFRSPAACLRLALLCAVCVQASACISFRSVIISASVGQLVGTRASAATTLPVLCEAENILSGAQPTCPLDQVQRYSDDMLRYSQSLAQYATMIRNLAEFDDPRQSDALTELLQSLARTDELLPPRQEPSGDPMAEAAAKITASVSQSWRRNKLETLVISTHPHVMAVIDGLLSRIALLSEPVKDMCESGLHQRQLMLQAVDSPPAGSATSPPAASVTAQDAAGRLQREADRLALLHFALMARRGYNALMAYQKALSAFKRAHTILFDYASQHPNGLADDTEMYDLLNKELPTILR